MQDNLKSGDYEYHQPVLRDLTIEFLLNDKNGIYIDGTLGGGGHAAAILSKLDSGGKLIGFDKDIRAIEHSKRIFAQMGDSVSEKFRLYNDCFSKSCEIVDTWGHVSGLLLDLGVSSRQLDSDSVGLSYRVNSKLDMRFGSQGDTAEDLLLNINEQDLVQILRIYGEEPFAKQIARQIIERRRTNALATTFDLRAAVEQSVSEKFRTKTLSRVFQAIRIVVNDELNVLERTLKCIIPKMAIGGRIVIMSYHSLEDNITKNIFKQFSKKRDGTGLKITPNLKIITTKPIEADENEIKLNPRSRSVKIRVAERI